MVRLFCDKCDAPLNKAFRKGEDQNNFHLAVGAVALLSPEKVVVDRYPAKIHNAMLCDACLTVVHKSLMEWE